MFKNILLMLGHQDKFSKKLISHLKKRCKKLSVSYPSSNSKNFFFNVKDKHYDFIFCFRSKYILKIKNLKKAKFATINFHPGPPKYRGTGCANYALFDNAKKYGVTSHLITSNKIDEGKIIDVVEFKIKKKENILSLLNTTNKYLYKQAIKIIEKLRQNPQILEILVKKFNKFKWSRKIKKRKYLDKFYKIDIKSSKKNFDKKIRCTYTNKFKPYIVLHGKTFIMK